MNAGHRSEELRDEERATVAAGKSPMAVAHVLNTSFARSRGLVADHYV